MRRNKAIFSSHQEQGKKMCASRAARNVSFTQPFIQGRLLELGVSSVCSLPTWSTRLVKMESYGMINRK